MLRRLLLGVVIGVVVGGLAAYAIAQAAPWIMAGALAYPLAAVIGVVVGLVAGRPIWAKGAAIEAGLKAVVGALLGAGLLFGLRYVHMSVPALWHVPPAPIGQHPLALAAVAFVLSVFYEVDDSGEPVEADHKRIASASTRVELPDGESADESASAAESKRGRQGR